jgi:hypothetical protein
MEFSFSGVLLNVTNGFEILAVVLHDLQNRRRPESETMDLIPVTQVGSGQQNLFSSS